MAKPKHNIKSDIKWEIYGLFLISFGILGIFSIYTNAVGTVGNLISKILKGFSGQAAVFIPIMITIAGIYSLFNKKQLDITFRILGFIIIFIVAVFLFHLKTHSTLMDFGFIDRLRKSADIGVNGIGGGILGETGLSLLISIFGTTGSVIIMVTFIIIGMVLITGKPITNVIRNTKKTFRSNDIPINLPTRSDNITVVNNNTVIPNQEKTENIVSERQKEKQTSKPVKVIKTEKEPVLIDDGSKREKEYRLPSITLLQKHIVKQSSFSGKELLKNAQILEDTLESFGLQVKVTQVNCGPTITRFEVQPAPGIKVSRIVNLANDIALGLAASNVRIEAPIPGKAAIGIEVPNKNKSLVGIRDVLGSEEFNNSASKLTIALGKDISGNPIVTDLANMPHLLIAGATGSGKSVCIKAIISCILYKAYPNEVKLMLIDPKMVELSVYDGISHLLTPVITDPKKAALALNWMVTEMERRYQAFAKEGVRDITMYNEISGEKPMPKIIVIIDELADLMMVSPKEIEDSICRLAQMARAAGIHLIVATQRPSVDIITGLIKANIPSRISFAVSSQVDSRTILDTSGAEKLLGKGDMLFFPVGDFKPTRIQSAYISEKEVKKLVDHVKSQQDPIYEEQLSDLKKADFDKETEDTDELFQKAVSVILDSGQASISMLQRRLKIGYTRAARLIDEMEERGIVGGYEGTKPREVLINKESLNKH